MKLVIIASLLISSTVFAKSPRVDIGNSDKVYKVDGKTVSIGDAVKSWESGKLVLQCKPLNTKGRIFIAASGDITGILDCKPVERVLNAKTGSETWKVVK